MIEQSLPRKIAAWVDARGRREGWIAFILMRLTGIALVSYLVIHLVALSTLLRGADAWADFLHFAHSPAVLALDGVLIFGILFHGLNGLRVGLLGLGYGSRYQAPLFWGAFGVTTILTGLAMWLILGIG
jgi:succinate dehydrogenase / fumarate reductase, cytochrome b subunit